MTFGKPAWQITAGRLSAGDRRTDATVAGSGIQTEHPKQQPSHSAEWLTLGDVQRMFQVSRSTVYRWTNEDGMPVRRVGGVVRLPADKVREWAGKHLITMPVPDGTPAG